ncbi:hypothetical protein P691DRAFT_780703 [Macrolepiota fuliginosa MF-IS2]|uniref:Uncharacterized protein n=1 Tax=Macrolepiota fuliginosa MF-IS2 TaxID=1400762 RepID=A0A9P6C4W0_9AGAR|nr:hypothetical protein P691DRAFT_780703 [Macrolepiota fuliginosa MF-IS2]
MSDLLVAAGGLRVADHVDGENTEQIECGMSAKRLYLGRELAGFARFRYAEIVGSLKRELLLHELCSTVSYVSLEKLGLLFRPPRCTRKDVRESSIKTQAKAWPHSSYEPPKCGTPDQNSVNHELREEAEVWPQGQANVGSCPAPVPKEDMLGPLTWRA